MGVISVTALNPVPASRSPSVLFPEMAGQTGVLGNVASGTALMGSPGMPLREAMRSFVIQPKLPDMYRRLQALEKELAELKKQL